MDTMNTTHLHTCKCACCYHCREIDVQFFQNLEIFGSIDVHMHVFSISLYEARKITPDNVGISIEVWTENHKHGLGNLISIDPWTCLVEKNHCKHADI